MSKHVLLVSALIASVVATTASAQSPRRADGAPRGMFTQTSIEKGWKSAVEQNKPMLVMFTSESCVHCRKMLSETYGHPAVRQMMAGNIVTVLAHAEDYRGLVKRLGIRGYPSSLLVSPKGDVLDFMEGFVDAKSFATRVRPLLIGRTARAGEPATAALTVQTSDR